MDVVNQQQDSNLKCSSSIGVRVEIYHQEFKAVMNSHVFRLSCYF